MLLHDVSFNAFDFKIRVLPCHRIGGRPSADLQCPSSFWGQGYLDLKWPLGTVWRVCEKIQKLQTGMLPTPPCYVKIWSWNGATEYQNCSPTGSSALLEELLLSITSVN